VVVVGIIVAVVAVVAMTGQAVRGNRTVGVQRTAVVERDAALDDAFYHCLDVQARGLIRPGEPVELRDDLAHLVTLIKAVGSWVTVADPASTAVAQLSLRDGVTGQDACLGTVVVARFPGPGPSFTERVGTGANVPGKGPPPAPPL
jgi:hypothetical protein